MMNTDSGKAIRACLKRMSDIVRLNATTSQLERSRSICAVARIVRKLDAQELPEQRISASDLESDSLEKVTYYIDLALKTFQSIGAADLDEVQQANFLFALSQTYENLGNYGAAITNYKMALQLSEKQQEPSLGAKIKYRMGRIYSERGDWQRATEHLTEASRQLESTGNPGEAALAQIEIAKISYRKGRYLDARRTFEQALEITDRVGNVGGRAVISNHLGVIRRMEGEYELAATHFHEALIEFQSIQDDTGAAESMNNLGSVHLQKQEFRQAIDYFERALQLCQSTGNFPLLPFIYTNRAEFYSRTGDYAMAANTCGRALEYFVKLKNPIGIARINMVFGRIFWKSGDLRTAEPFYRESILLYETFDIPLGLANCHREFATVLAETGRMPESVEHDDKAEEIYRKLHMQNRDLVAFFQETTGGKTGVEGEAQTTEVDL